MNLNKYFWDLNEKAILETRNILKNHFHPKFVMRAIALLSRCDKVKEIFSVIPKEEFVLGWPAIYRVWKKTNQAPDFLSWWQTIYEQLTEKKYTKRTEKRFLIAGEQIKNKRIELDLSQSELARRLDMKQSHISALEAGKSNITLETLIKICEVLGIKEIKIL